MRGKFYRKELSKEFINGLNYKSGGLQGICITISNIVSSFPKFLPEQQKLEGKGDVVISQKNPTHHCSKFLQEEIHVF